MNSLIDDNGERIVIPEYTSSLYSAVAKHALTLLASVQYSELEPCLGGYLNYVPRTVGHYAFCETL